MKQMRQRSNLQRILDALKPDITAVDFSEFDKSVSRLKENLKEKIQVKTVDDVNRQLNSFKTKLNIDGITDAVKGVKEQLRQRVDVLESLLADQSTELKELLSKNDGASTERIATVSGTIQAIRQELADTNEQSNGQIKSVQDRVEKLQEFMDGSNQTLDSLAGEIANIKASTAVTDLDGKLQQVVLDIEQTLTKLRTEFNNRITNIQGGGNMNRQIRVEGVDVLTKYTDINFYGVTSSVISSVDATNKRVNIGIQGGGGGGGTPSSPNTSVQFNDGGSFGGDAHFLFDKTTNTVTLGAEDAEVATLQAPAGSTDLFGGYLSIKAGAGNGAGRGGILRLNSGEGGATENGGALFVTSGAGGATSGDGGLIQITGGYAPTNGDGGSFFANAGGGAGAGKNGGSVVFTSGAGGGVGGAAGDVVFNLSPASGGIDGKFKFNPKGGGTYGILDFDSIANPDKTFTFPNQTGTIASPSSVASAGLYLQTLGGGLSQWSSVVASGGSGITRTTSVISVSSTFGAAAATDYVAFTNVGVNVTLPTAIGNNNQYTVKNISTSSVLVTTTAGQTIDGSDSALMPVQNQSLSFISNNSVWGVV